MATTLFEQFSKLSVYFTNSNSRFVQRILFFSLIFFIVFQSSGQDSLAVRKKVYKYNYKWEAPLTVGLFALNYYGFGVIRQKPTLDSMQVFSLDKNEIWAFDRIALNQKNTSKYKEAQKVSDWGMNIMIFAPILLFIDKDIRHSWLDVSLLYLETQAINSNLYTWFGPAINTRTRPLVYYQEVPMDEKLSGGTTDSFFSGHTSWTAGASFFMAKVYSDFHPELGRKKWWLFAAALIPPAFVGYHRYRGLKHFPTDIMVGTAIGAAAGILTPHLHKVKKNKRTTMSIAPFSGQYSGLAFRMKF